MENCTNIKKNYFKLFLNFDLKYYDLTNIVASQNIIRPYYNKFIFKLNHRFRIKDKITLW